MKARKSRLLAIACSQEGYFTAKQAQKAGYDSRLRAYHKKTGSWTRVYRGIYRLTGFPATLEGKYVLWSLWSRNRSEQTEGIFSHQTALAIHGLASQNSPEIHMAVPPSFRRNSEIPRALRLHKQRIPTDSIEERNGFRVVTADYAVRQVYPDRETKSGIPDTGFSIAPAAPRLAGQSRVVKITSTYVIISEHDRLIYRRFEEERTHG